MNKTSKFLLIVAMIGFAISLLTSCTTISINNNGLGYSANVVRINCIRKDSSPSILMDIIQEKGYLEKYLPSDVAVEWVYISSQPEARDALALGKLDLAVLSSTYCISAVANELPIVPVSMSVSATTNLYSHTERISKLSEIEKNDKIALTSLGSTNHYFLKLAAEEEFNDTDKFDNNLIAMPFSEMWASLETNSDLSVVAMSFPQTVKADKSNILSKLLSLSEIAEKYKIPNMIISGNEGFCRDNSLIIELFNKALTDAADFIKNEPAAAAVLLSNYLDVDADLIQQEFTSYIPKVEISESGYNTLATLMYESGVLDNAPKKFTELPNYATIPKTK
jgi:ABC-type nitrate/sulfonate/bicarbonate transport system substrate-binding protein